MPEPRRKTPPGKGGVRDGLGSCAAIANTVAASRAQFLINAHRVRPEWAGLLAELAFGGG